MFNTGIIFQDFFSCLLTCQFDINYVVIILFIFVGENSIVIVSGANDILSEDDVRKAKSVISSASVCVCQLEINPEVTHFTLSTAKRAGGMFWWLLRLGCVSNVVQLLCQAGSTCQEYYAIQ